MTRAFRRTTRFISFVLITILVTTGPAFAGENNSKHKNKNGKKASESHYSKSQHGEDHERRRYFGSEQRDVIRQYYDEEYRSGKCPPGLAKKHNGCLPPGQAQKWQIGHVLPRDVVFYDLPSSVTVRLGVPPEGHRFVRVASDILLIAVGTGMVVDALEDLGNL